MGGELYGPRAIEPFISCRMKVPPNIMLLWHSSLLSRLCSLPWDTIRYNTIRYNATLLIPYGKLLVYLLAGNIIHAYLHKTSNNIIMYRVIAHVHQLVKT